MNVAIPLLSDSNNDFLELRYALRGLQEFIDPKKVYLIGGLPKWIKGVKHIQSKDATDPKYREKNIFDKLLLCPDEEFIYFSDDNFLMEIWEEKYPYDGTLLNKMYNLPRGSMYRNTIANTLKYNHRLNNYDVHAPLLINKDVLNKMKKFPWGQNFGFCMKSLYAMTDGITGTQVTDMKIRRGNPVQAEALKLRPWFSTSDDVIESIKPVMDELFPKPSKWEV